MNIDALINNTYEYISQKGFKYTKDTIYNLFLALKTQHFVILNGQSGSGKSSLARLYAESMGADEINGRFKTVCIEPHWHDSEKLLGSLGHDGLFKKGIITEFLRKAMLDTSKPYFLCLEDFNLSRPGEYMVPILYALSHKHYSDNAIVTSTVYYTEFFGKDEESLKLYGDIRICDNLYIIATSSTDEASYPITDKILEYSFPMELQTPDITFSFAYPEDKPEPVSPFDVDNEWLKCDFITSADFTGDYENTRDFSYVLQRLNQTVLGSVAPISMHTRDAILIYTFYNRRFDVFTQAKAIDYIILQKVLPHIHGGTAMIQKCLSELFLYCMTKGGENADIYPDSYVKMAEAKSIYGCRYPLSAEKIAAMMRRYEYEGYATYWR